MFPILEFCPEWHDSRTKCRFQSKRRLPHLCFCESSHLCLHFAPYLPNNIVSSLGGSRKNQEPKKHFLKRYSETSCLDLLKGPSSPRSRKYSSAMNSRASARNPTFLLPELDPFSSVPLGLWMGHDPVVVFCHGLGFSTLPWRMQPGEGHLYLHTLKHTRSAGASHGSPRAQTCTFEGPSASNTTQIPREDPQEREDRMNIVAGGEKSEKIWAVPRESGPARERSRGERSGGGRSGGGHENLLASREGGGGTGGHRGLWSTVANPIRANPFLAKISGWWFGQF